MMSPWNPTFQPFQQHLVASGAESDGAIQTPCSPNQCHIPRPYLVSVLDTEEEHGQMDIAQSF
jgi:hypothetical protein